MHCQECEDPCRHIIEHDPGALWKSLQLAYRRRLDDVEGSEKYKTGEKSFPRQGDGDQRDQLSGNLIDHDKLRILRGRSPRYASCCGDTDERDQRGHGDGYWRPQRGR